MVKQGITQIIEPGTPSWFSRFVLRLEGFFVAKFPASPVRVPAFDTEADLPPAEMWRACIVFVSDTGAFMGSDGANWSAF